MSDAIHPDTAAADVAVTLGLQEGGRGRSWTRFVLVGAVGIVVIVGTVATWRFVATPRVPSYVMADVTRGDLHITVTATGTLQPVNKVDVGAEISGRVLTVSADFNQRVARGDVLATLDTEQLASRVKEAAASLQAAQAGLAQATATATETRQNAQRSEALSTAGLLATQDRDGARAALARADAAVASARAQSAVAQAGLDGAQTNLDKAVIRSPISGIVIARAVEPGQTVAASFQTPVLFTLAADLSQMALHVDVDEADVGHVSEGQQATFTVDAFANREFPAHIVSLRNAARTVQGVVTYEAVLAVTNADGVLRPGMTATATIATDTRADALLVPNAALRFTPPAPAGAAAAPAVIGSMARIWTLVGGAPRPMAVEAGASDGRLTEVVASDLQPGTRVLVDLAPGSR